MRSFCGSSIWEARYTSWIRPDPGIGYRYEPNAAYWFDLENDHPITGRINSHGWRDRERAIAKPADTIRVAVLGDSFVSAFHVELEKTFPALAEGMLNAAGGRKFELFFIITSGRCAAF